MSNVVIDVNKCTGCGLCTKDCVGFAIAVKDGKAVVNESTCIKCGHCEAVCPNHAATLTGYEDSVEDFAEQTRLNPEELMMAIKTRRTIRQFKSDEVTQNIIEMIIESGRLAPTGTNAQGTGYIVLQQKKNECEAAAVKMFSKVLGLGKIFLPMLKSMNIDENFFFKKAPLVIVVTGNDKVSASLAAENMAFMAEANGLGVLFSGFFTTCFNLSGKIKKLIGVNKKTKAVTTMIIGYPAVKYHRTAHRNSANIIKA